MTDDNDKEQVLGCVISVLWFPFLTVGSCLWTGFVLTRLWAWFIVPTFALPRLSLSAAIGLALVVGLIAKGSHSNSDDKRSALEITAYSTFTALLIPAIFLLAGYITSRYMP